LFGCSTELGLNLFFGRLSNFLYRCVNSRLLFWRTRRGRRGRCRRFFSRRLTFRLNFFCSRRGRRWRWRRWSFFRTGLLSLRWFITRPDTASADNVHKSLQNRTGTAANGGLINDARIKKFFGGVVSLLREVLENSCRSFLRAFSHTGNTCATDALSEAPCKGFGINLTAETIENLGDPGKT